MAPLLEAATKLAWRDKDSEEAPTEAALAFLPDLANLTRYRRGLGAWSDWEDEQMVSTDHFRQELFAQLGRAATQGRIDILINSGELYRSITRGGFRSGSCCDAMQEEFKMGDTLLLDRTNGAGMTVRYLLPRTLGIQISLPLESSRPLADSI
jgi:hypothetical protein